MIERNCITFSHVISNSLFYWETVRVALKGPDPPHDLFEVYYFIKKFLPNHFILLVVTDFTSRLKLLQHSINGLIFFQMQIISKCENVSCFIKKYYKTSLPIGLYIDSLQNLHHIINNCLGYRKYHPCTMCNVQIRKMFTISSVKFIHKCFLIYALKTKRMRKDHKRG